jgi:hypothetical protein
MIVRRAFQVGQVTAQLVIILLLTILPVIKIAPLDILTTVEEMVFIPVLQECLLERLLIVSQPFVKMFLKDLVTETNVTPY